MLSPNIWQTPLVMLSTLFPIIWIQNPTLENYTLQACGGVVIAYIVIKKFLRGANHQNLLTLLFFNLITQTLIFSTGKANSPLFFLYYFVFFAFAIYFDRFQIFVICLTTFVCHFIFRNNTDNIFDKDLFNLISLILITPLASIYNKAAINAEVSKQKLHRLENDLAESETDSLLWLSTEEKPLINKSIDNLTDLVIYLKSSRSISNLPKSFLDKLKATQADLLTLYSSSDILEESLKKKPDNNKNKQ